MKTNFSSSGCETWDVASADFPCDATARDKLLFALQYAILAPSSHNTQPWLFRVRDNAVEIHASRTRCLRVSDPEDREMIISCGAALFHLRVALRHFGHACQVETFPDPGDPDLLARVRLGLASEASAEDTILLNAIPKRRTNRQPFRDEAVPEALLSVLQGVSEKEGASLHFVRPEDERYAVADLIAEADRVQWANKRFRLELAAWAHPNRGADCDGIPGYANGMTDLLSLAGPLVIRTFDLGAGRAAKDREIAIYSPALAVLWTADDKPADWLAAGQALAHVLLRARVEDVHASFLNQPVEVPELRAKLRWVINRNGFPQIILRLGFGEEVRPTPRRSVNDFLI